MKACFNLANAVLAPKIRIFVSSSFSYTTFLDLTILDSKHMLFLPLPPIFLVVLLSPIAINLLVEKSFIVVLNIEMNNIAI